MKKMTKRELARLQKEVAEAYEEAVREAAVMNIGDWVEVRLYRDEDDGAWHAEACSKYFYAPPVPSYLVTRVEAWSPYGDEDLNMSDILPEDVINALVADLERIGEDTDCITLGLVEDWLHLEPDTPAKAAARRALHKFEEDEIANSLDDGYDVWRDALALLEEIEFQENQEGKPDV